MCHVLVIEDEFLVALYIQTVLEENGATSVEIVSTEKEAIESALKDRPAVITSDIKLGEGDGLKAVKTIHEKSGAIPVIFITSSPEACDLRGPHVRILAKPAADRSIGLAFKEMLSLLNFISPKG